jgi:hypothetical protein
LIVSTIASKGSKKLEMEAECLYDDVMTLKTAIEEAIIKGQKPFGALSDVTESGMTSDEESDLVSANGFSGVVGWIDDL